MANPNTIFLKGLDNRRTIERLTAATIAPGYLVELYDASGTQKVRKHSTAYGKAARFFALEQEYLGTGINVSTKYYAAKTTVSYANGDQVIIHPGMPGDEIYAKLAASATAVVDSDLLVSAGDGTLKKAVAMTAAAGTAITTNILADVTGTPTQTLINNDFATVAALAAMNIVGQALESVDNSGGASEAFIRIVLW